eukprot:COSAG02_NODE_580_length_20059_cov_3.703908_7_plen_231_part_00
MPWDLAVQAVAEKVAEIGKGEQLRSVRCYDDMRGSASGGTMATVFESLQDRAKYVATCCVDEASGKPFDPLLRESAPGQAKSSCATKANNQSCCGYSQEGKAWVGPFVMAMVMANCVRRSNALLCYGPKLRYYEAARFPNFPAAFVNMFGLIMFGTALSCPPLAWLLRTFCLPSPGQGELTFVVVHCGTHVAAALQMFCIPLHPPDGCPTFLLLHRQVLQKQLWTRAFCA